jgi:hypothetical protein
MPEPHNGSNAYESLNDWLHPLVDSYAFWLSDEFDVVERRLRELPVPDSEEGREAVRVSRLGDTLGRLAAAVGRAVSARPAARDLEGEPDRDRLHRLWDASRPFAACLPSRSLRAFLSSGGAKRAEPRILADVLYVAWERGSLADVVGTGAVRALAEQVSEDALFDALEAAGVERIRTSIDVILALGGGTSLAWGELAKEAGMSKSAEGLGVLWEYSAPYRAKFSSFDWGMFARAASVASDGELLGRIWNEYCRVRSPLQSAAWMSFTRSAITLRRADIFVSVWAGARLSIESLNGEAWGWLASGARDLFDDADVLTDVWETWRDSRRPAVAATRAEFLRAAGQMRRRDLAEDMWSVFAAAAGEFEPQMWSMCTSVAAKVGSVPMFRGVWRRWQRLRGTVNEQTWGSFAKAAAALQQFELLPEMWRETGEIRSTLNPAKDHAFWGTFVHGATRLEDPVLLREVFRDICNVYDPIVFKNVGTLFRPILQAALTCSDRDLRTEILDTLRNRRIDELRCLDLLSDEAVAAEDERLGGAARCLVRGLIASFFFDPEDEFERRAHRIVDRVLALGEPAQRAIWPQLIGRGQEAFKVCIRARYADAFSETVGLETKPWRDFSDDERRRAAAAILDDSEAGVRARINRMIHLGYDELHPRAERVSDPEWEPFVEARIRNHIDYLNGVAAPEEDYFAGLEANLDEIGHALRGRDDWARMMMVLVSRSAEELAVELLPKIHTLTHDVHKVVCADASWLLAAAESDEAAERIVADLVGLLQLFEIACLRVGLARREVMGIAIAPSLVRILGKSFANVTSSHVDIPKRVRIEGWPGVRDEHVEPLLYTIRANVRSALRGVDEAKRYYACRVTEDERRVRIAVENTYDPDGSKSPFSTGIGMHSIRTRVVLLGGRDVTNGPTDEVRDGLPVWRLSFDLPAYDGEDEEA